MPRGGLCAFLAQAADDRVWGCQRQQRVAAGEVGDKGEGHRDRAGVDVVPADVSADDPDVFRLGSLLSLRDVELDLSPPGQRSGGSEHRVGGACPTRPGGPFTLADRAAGVGQGTLYRRFPTRDHLFAAILQDRVDELEMSAQRALGAPDVWQALSAWLKLYDQRDWPSSATCRQGSAHRELIFPP